jgi:hypothetical protein
MVRSISAKSRYATPIARPLAIAPPCPYIGGYAVRFARLRRTLLADATDALAARAGRKRLWPDR